VVLREEARFVAAFGRYLVAVARPLLLLAVPFALLLAHLDARYAHRALHPSERSLVKIVTAPSAFDDWRLETADGIDVDSRPVHIRSRGEIDWRIHARAPGRHQLRFVTGDRKVIKEVRVDLTVAGAPARRATASLWSLFLASGELPIDDGAGIETIDIGYPPLTFAFVGGQVSWIIVFVIVLAAVALAVSRQIGVELW